ncbi:flavin-containing monooxygenase 5-like [Ruditapes philippinarum]|uniref:flavin-containing monooxygenase 5-like n=1 Tax=Ruditapes philippinarum TaxID=129788 RepID=UPI00295B307D|nr:flavin-containing monooxygenase 5-like [Ruditapes philippinarum]
MSKTCCVIGAGVAGLAGVKQCLEEGIKPVCFEKDFDIGGLWHYRDYASNDQEPSLYNSCSINTSKEMTCYSDFPIPKDFPNFMHHTHFKKYLELYAENFDLMNYIKLQTEVIKVEKADNFEETGQWIVTTRDLKSNKTSKEKFDFVMIANGHLTEPNKPSLPGLEKFKGKVLHTHDYKDFRGFENLNVLIVGIGNSAADVGCELSRHAKHVYMSTRRGTYTIQRAADFGVPYDHIAITRFRQSLSWKLMRPYHFYKLNHRYRHRNYGLSPNFNFESAGVTISDDLPNRILLGAISIHNDVKHFTEDGAVFVDGTQIKDIDVVVLGTGYVYSFPFLDESIIKRDGHFSYLYKLVWPTELNPSTLAVIGLVQPFGPLPPVLEAQARWAAHVFAGRSQLPTNAKRLDAVEKWREFVKQKYVDSPRYTTQIYFIQYIDEVAKFIGCRPNLWKLFFKDINLWSKVVFNPATPPQWRLEGPGKWEGARNAISRVEEKTWYPMQTRKAGDHERDGLYDGWIELFKKLAIVILGLILIKFLFSNGYHTLFIKS